MAKPVQSLADLKGIRMRAYNPATSMIAELLGAQPVTVQPAALPQMTADWLATAGANGKAVVDAFRK